MNPMRAMLAAGAALVVAGCAAAPAPVAVVKEGDPARACLALARKAWDRDVLESLRCFRKGAELRDAEACRQYLAHAETRFVNLSQRVYARLFVERVLRQGPVQTAAGEDIRPDLYAQLAAAWRTTEPRSPSKAAQVEEAMRADVRFAGALMYAGESADEMKRWLQVPLLGEGRAGSAWTIFEANAWGGGSDRLLLGTNVLAFLVNPQGEPSFRGTQLWICNLGANSVFVTSLSTGLSDRELQPGRDALVPLVAAENAPVTGIPLSVRYRRLVR